MKLRIIIPVRGRKLSQFGFFFLSHNITIKNHNPRKGTETYSKFQFLLYSFFQTLRIIIPVRGRKRLKSMTVSSRIFITIKNHNPRKGTETAFAERRRIERGIEN